MEKKRDLLVKVCPCCNNNKLYYLFSIRDTHRVVMCQDCGLLLLNPQPSDEELDAIYGPEYFLGNSLENGTDHQSRLKQATAVNYLNLLARYRGASGGELLEVGPGQGNFLAAAASQGYNVTGLEYSSCACDVIRSNLQGRGRVICGEIDQLSDEQEKYDVCILSDVIEHTRDPRSLLHNIHRLLKPGGVIFASTPSTDSWPAKLMKTRWMEFKIEHLFYFSRDNLESLLFRCGFHQMITVPAVKSLSLDYITAHFQRFPVPVVSRCLSWLYHLVPAFLRRKPIQVNSGGVIVMARSRKIEVQPKLTIIMPAYNEVNTVEAALTKVLEKHIEGLGIEVVLVESNSTDGTRQAVQKYQDHPRVNLVLEDRPQGKGHAVRTGLRHATGDFILIQDADLEYDLEDYDVLLEPLIFGRKSFVLGSRHGGRTWKIRKFEGSPLTTMLFNAVHWILTAIIDVLFWLPLKDPFTMFKVFRADCLYGLTFECNRFDFDYELLLKLVRKGYKPIEIPVNYRSRTFEQGKKVSIYRDPLTWIWAIAKYRAIRLDLLKDVEKAHAAKSEPQPS
ncbi:MAG: glycosyltransferase [Deltaproteobacteria bacterium]|nr:glycosyltransferase [Deltaproteobacteria bacterium]